MPLPELLAHLVYNLVFVSVFGFYAMRQDSDPEECIAMTDNNTVLVKVSASDQENDPVDVGSRFRFCFEILFVTHLV